ncbi:MAG: hypothetical protein ACP5NY_04885 [Thermocladium sp.]|mgnify:CR=1 FL=1
MDKKESCDECIKHYMTIFKSLEEAFKVCLDLGYTDCNPEYLDALEDK